MVASGTAAAAAVDQGELREAMRLYNTMTRSKDPFEPLAPPKVSFYSCGPTVYDFAHIGNFRAFLTYDVLKKWLRYCGFDVEHVCNLTDIDDKIIARMARDGVSLKELTNTYADYFFEDLAALNVEKADHYPRATEHVDDIVAMVSELVEREAAYEENGSYYFEVGKAARYGRLARLDFDGMADGAGERNEDERGAGAGTGGGAGGSGEEKNGENNPGYSTDLPDASEGIKSEKRGARDFALWKAFKPGKPEDGGDGEVAWETSLGKGRPGWHIECSAMCRRFFGDQIDLHAGGVDLVFPHHENEIAQTEAVIADLDAPPDAPPRDFCKHWVHNGFVNVDNQKMSKSKGNFLTLRGRFASAPGDIRAFRYLVVMSQYRMGLNYTPEALAAARNAVKKLDRFRANVLAAAVAAEPAGSESTADEEATATAADAASVVESATSKALANFHAAMSDDLNTPRAGAALFGLVKAVQPLINSDTLTPPAAAVVSECLDAMNGVLGVFYELPPDYVASALATTGQGGGAADSAVPDEILELVRKRTAAKEAKDWAVADELRDAVAAAGYTIKDVKGGEPAVSKL